MIIEDRIISVNSYKCDINEDELTKIIDDSKYPKETEYYTYGFFRTSKVGNRNIFTLAVMLNSTRKELIEKGNTFEIGEKPSKTLFFGNIFYLKDKKIIGLVNSNNIVTNQFKNLIAPHELKKITVADDIYLKMYRNSLVKTACGIILKKPTKNYKMNISSETLEDNELTDIFGAAEINSVSFNGKIFQEREISFKLNKSGNVTLYNSSKNPLEWEDIFNFMNDNVYS